MVLIKMYNWPIVDGMFDSVATALLLELSPRLASHLVLFTLLGATYIRATLGAAHISWMLEISLCEYVVCLGRKESAMLLNLPSLIH